MLRFIKYLNKPLKISLSGNRIQFKNCIENYESFRSVSYMSRKYSSVKVEKDHEVENNNNNNPSNIIDNDKERKVKILQLEIDVARQEGRKVPDPEFLKEQHWEHLLTLSTRSARTKYYTYLWKLERKKENKEIKKAKAQEELRQKKEKEKLELELEGTENHIKYGLMHTGFLLRIYDATINHWNNNKLIQAMQFGQKLIFDCSYDENMTKREAINTAKQLMFSFAENRINDEPFDLHFCNFNSQSTTLEYLHKHIPTLFDPEFPLNIHKECFTKLFPKEKLVYLTPHCRNDLIKFNPDDLYIIGAIVDKVNNEPLSLAKAKKLGIRMARLPLDRYLQWGAGSGKSLTLNQMINILLDIKKTGDWNHSLRHVPRRKIFNEENFVNQNKIRRRANKFNFTINKLMENKIIR